jgi:riboflavin kinase/FMN adenylyltransferase
VELLHKLHDELKYDSLDALTGIAKDCDDARVFSGPTYRPTPRRTETRRQTTRDRI